MSRRWQVPGVRLVTDAWRPRPVSEMPTEPATPAAWPWHGVGEPPAADEPSLAERLYATQQRPIKLSGDWKAAASQHREVRESPAGVLAVYDRRRTGRPTMPWLVIDVPPGHHTHHCGQPLSHEDVRDWALLIRERQP